MNTPVRIVKRLIDCCLSSIGLVASAPLMAIIAVAIKGSSKGRIFYKQKRAGMITGSEGDGPSEFWMYKFRTMVENAEKETGAVLAARKDARVTRIGHILRATRLDELPQLLNVLKGEMSMVGPRPERPELIENLSMAIPFFEERMRFVKPGITGMAQVNLSYTGRMPKNSRLFRFKDTLLNPFDLPETQNSVADDMRTKILYDFVYSAMLEKFGLFLRTDTTIMLKTPFVMFFSRFGQ
ncbi:MAG: sugar transferase [Myxococcota bacterium]|nr:sugar transferase [Myxococcota bacterium]